MAKDYYSILGVAKTATKEEIKKAYRKLARKWHPDINPGNKSAEQKFKEISVAYDCIGNDEKRKLYDEFGEEGLNAGFDADKARQYHQQGHSSGGPRWEGRPEDFGRYQSYEDIFGDIFGFGNAGSGFGAQAAKGRDLEYEMQVDLISALKGFETEITLNKQSACSACKGKGAAAGAQPTSCGTCKGTGRLNVAEGPINFTRTCLACNGTGQITPPCPICKGTGRVPGKDKIKVTVPKGVKDGSRVRVAGKGEPGTGNAGAGDLFLIIRVPPHAFMERKEDDLYMDVPVTVHEALAGGSITVPTLDGHVKVKVPAGSQSGRTLKIKGKGAFNLKTKTNGDLFIRLVVKIPETGDAAILEAAKKMEAHYASDVRKNIRL